MNIPDDRDWESESLGTVDEDYDDAKNRWKGKSLSDVEEMLKDQSIALSSLLEDLKNMPRIPFIYYFPTVSKYMTSFTDFSFVYSRFEFFLDLHYLMRIVIHHLKTHDCAQLWESIHDLVNFLKANIDLLDEYKDGQFSDSLVDLASLTAEAEHLLAIVQKVNP